MSPHCKFTCLQTRSKVACHLIASSPICKLDPRLVVTSPRVQHEVESHLSANSIQGWMSPHYEFNFTFLQTRFKVGCHLITSSTSPSRKLDPRLDVTSPRVQLEVELHLSANSIQGWMSPHHEFNTRLNLTFPQTRSKVGCHLITSSTSPFCKLDPRLDVTSPRVQLEVKLHLSANWTRG